MWSCPTPLPLSPQVLQRLRDLAAEVPSAVERKLQELQPANKGSAGGESSL